MRCGGAPKHAIAAVGFLGILLGRPDNHLQTVVPQTAGPLKQGPLHKEGGFGEQLCVDGVLAAQVMLTTSGQVSEYQQKLALLNGTRIAFNWQADVLGQARQNMPRLHNTQRLP